MLYRVPVASRRRAESLMTDTCTTVRPVAPTSLELDPVTLLPVTTAPTAIYVGPCRIRIRRVAASGGASSVGPDNPSVLDSAMSVPYSAPLHDVNDIVTLTASLEQPGMVGLRFRVTGILPNTQATAQRLMVEAVTG